MRAFCLFLFLLGIGSACHAAEIVAWKVPVTSIGEEGLATKGVVKLAAPPEVSVFLNKGDELWDVLQVVESQKPPALDWLIWNATSQRLVAKGGKLEIGAFHHRLHADQSPVNIRILFEVFRNTTGRIFSGEGTPELSYSLLSAPGRRIEGSQDGREKWIRMTGSAWLGDFILLELDLDCLLKGQPEFHVETSIRPASGQPVWVAGDWDGETGLDLRVTATVELPDGTPRADLILRQNGGVVERIDFRPRPIGTMKVRDGHFKAIRVSKGLFGGDHDPFDSTDAPPKPLDLPAVVPPPHLAEWVCQPVQDITGVFRKEGLELGAGDFAAYDPVAEIAYLYVREPRKLEKFESVFDSTAGPPPPQVMFALDGPYCASIMGSSGGRPLRLDRGVEDRAVASTKMEPQLEDLWKSITVGVEHHSDQDGRKMTLDTRVDLKDRAVTPISGPTQTPGFRLKAEVIPEDPRN